MYLHAAAEQQELQEEEHGAPGEGHAGGELLPSGRRGSGVVGATLRSLRVGHAQKDVHEDRNKKVFYLLPAR